MPTKDIGLYIAHRHIQFLGNKRAETGRIENARHAHHAIAWETTEPIGKLRHRIQWVCDHNHDAIGRVFDNLFSDLSDNLLVLLDQVVTAHTWLTWETGSDHDDIRVGSVGIIICANDQRIIANDRPRLEHIQGLTLRHVRNNVIHDHIGIVAFYQTLDECTANKASSNNGYFTAHQNILSVVSYVDDAIHSSRNSIHL